MKKKFAHVYQFKITLKGSKPPIWRRIQVPETYTFWDLHVAIQNAMGWGGGHLHAFEMRHPLWRKDDHNKRYTRSICFSGKRLSRSTYRRSPIGFLWKTEWRIISTTWRRLGTQDRIGKDTPSRRKHRIPICIAGKRACPPEDCGGIWGYKEFLEAIRDPEHENHEELLEWVGGEFDRKRLTLRKSILRIPMSAENMNLRIEGKYL
jgi:hypothetical protein